MNAPSSLSGLLIVTLKLLVRYLHAECLEIQNLLSSFFLSEVQTHLKNPATCPSLTTTKITIKLSCQPKEIKSNAIILK